MNTNQVKSCASEMKETARDCINNPQSQCAIDKGKDALDKGKDILDKGKDMLNKGKDKLEDFVEDKTDGKGVLGFGSKD